MGKRNINKRLTATIFIDLDGTIVKHNYDPENIDDIILPGVIEILQTYMYLDCDLILTTARSLKHCRKIIKKLSKEYEIEFSNIITDLSAGIRILINDNKELEKNKAICINVERDKGFKDANYFLKDLMV
jgi:hydroxymethylpyrimidine pyrophosphatase-like HAD family hydrolase